MERHRLFGRKSIVLAILLAVWCLPSATASADPPPGDLDPGRIQCQHFPGTPLGCAVVANQAYDVLLAFNDAAASDPEAFGDFVSADYSYFWPNGQIDASLSSWLSTNSGFAGGGQVTPVQILSLDASQVQVIPLSYRVVLMGGLHTGEYLGTTSEGQVTVSFSIVASDVLIRDNSAPHGWIFAAGQAGYATPFGAQWSPGTPIVGWSQVPA